MWELIGKEDIEHMRGLPNFLWRDAQLKATTRTFTICTVFQPDASAAFFAFTASMVICAISKFPALTAIESGFCPRASGISISITLHPYARFAHAHVEV